MHKIAILDFNSETVFLRDLTAKQSKLQAEDAAELVAEELGVELGNCEYMVGKLNIEIQ